MQIIEINNDNVHLIVQENQINEKINNEFINALWKYVLFSRNVSRTMPSCKICHKLDVFEYEGFGGIKEVGNGVMCIPSEAGDVYIIPDILFHYFYSHNLMPTKMFRDAVINGPKPDTQQYGELIREAYCLYKKRVQSWKHINCSCCGEPFEGTMAYVIGRKRKSIHLYHEKFYHGIFRKDVGVCFNCLHYTKI